MDILRGRSAIPNERCNGTAQLARADGPPPHTSHTRAPQHESSPIDTAAVILIIFIIIIIMVITG